jgi:hypothetical protein
MITHNSTEERAMLADIAAAKDEFTHDLLVRLLALALRIEHKKKGLSFTTYADHTIPNGDREKNEDS